MKRSSFVGIVLVLVLLATSSGGAAILASDAPDPEPIAQEVLEPDTAAVESNLAAQPIIIDHTCTDLGKIPAYWIEQAKALLRASYGHTSHGSQPVTGMRVLENGSLNVGGLYDFNTSGAVVSGELSLDDYTPSGDLGNPDRTTWATRTRDYLNGTGSDRNVVVWSWCGQANTTEVNINTYLNLMNGLEQEFPNVTFVYMTGHLNGTGEAGNLNARNNQIRDYCIANNKVLFDFADIESYDPDGNYFLDLDAEDDCDYDGGNWADQWCAANAGDPLCASCSSCAHSRCLNCNLKGRAFWWMMARIAGWEGTTDVIDGTAQKAASTIGPAFGEAVTYTIVLQDLTVPPTATVTLTDVVPLALSYISNTLTASTGTADDGNVPTLSWSGILSPTPAVTITYAVTVTAADPQVITNTAFVAVQGYQTISRTATIIANAYPVYLPLVLKENAP